MSSTTTTTTNGIQERWMYSTSQLSSTPSIKAGMDEQEELFKRQACACLIRQIGQKLKESCKRPSALSVATAMVYMHRFYMFHKFQDYPPQSVAPCALFLAAKVEETPVKLEYVIKTTHIITNPSAPPLHPQDKLYEERQRELIANENLLLQTLGFEMIVHHPHTLVVMGAERTGIPRVVTNLAYDLATNSLHFTKMCLKYKPNIVAYTCIYIALKRFSIEPVARDGKDWWEHLDPNLTKSLLDRVSDEYIEIWTLCKKSFNKWITVKNEQVPSNLARHSNRNPERP